jgi:excisionase family DNA binding protein
MQSLRTGVKTMGINITALNEGPPKPRFAPPLSPEDQDQNKDLLSVDEMAALLRVPKSWIYGQTRLKNEDPIPYLMVGKYLRFRPHKVFAWLERRTLSRRGQ